MNTDNMRKIGFYPGSCKGCEACVSLAPECFDWNEDTEQPVLKKDCVDETTARQLASFCPEDCIEIEE